MGFFKTAFFIFAPLTSYSFYLSMKLGPQLPAVCRKTGNHIGLFYRYFKVMLTSMRPKDNSGELMALFRKSSFKTQAFARESQLHFLNMKKETTESLPTELVKDPFEKFRLKTEIVDIKKGLSGAETIKEVYEESERLRSKTVEERKRNEFYDKL